MIFMRKALRTLYILHRIACAGLEEIFVNSLGKRRFHWTRLLSRCIGWLYFRRDLSLPRGQRLRQTLEKLGPIFIKFGQALSTRQDLIPSDIIDDLTPLQDHVPPFSSDCAIAAIQGAFGIHPDDLFASFNREPVASASVAQVHFAQLQNGKDVVVKILRPGIQKIIEEDLALMHLAATWIEKLWSEGRRLKMRDVVAEFDKYLHHELDLMREAANGSQLRRNFINSPLLLIPEMMWDFCSPSVIVMERMKGIPISHIARLKECGIDLKKLAHDGVEIFFTQIFRDAFFHADMHPGNILVSVEPATFGRYIALDFGIIGILNNEDKHYLLENFLAFFCRDYRRVAVVHVESGWAPATTRIDELESAVRACCEPIFNRPLKDISFAQVLLRLFQTSRHFHIEVQPQLVLLQKTLLNVESLGRQLDPDLDLWKIGKCHLEHWMNTHLGVRGLVQQIQQEVPNLNRLLVELPSLIHRGLKYMGQPPSQTMMVMQDLILEQQKTRRLLMVTLSVSLVLIMAVMLFYWR